MFLTYLNYKPLLNHDTITMYISLVAARLGTRDHYSSQGLGVENVQVSARRRGGHRRSYQQDVEQSGIQSM